MLSNGCFDYARCTGYSAVDSFADDHFCFPMQPVLSLWVAQWHPYYGIIGDPERFFECVRD